MTTNTQSSEKMYRGNSMSRCVEVKVDKKIPCRHQEVNLTLSNTVFNALPIDLRQLSSSYSLYRVYLSL